jgi:transposase
MAYREVTMLEIKEVLRLWQAGVGKKRIAVHVGLDPKTVRRYIDVAVRAGLQADGELTEELVAEIVGVLRTLPPRTRGSAWETCVVERDFIEGLLRDSVRLTKVWRLLKRRGIELPYSTLHRFARDELTFGATKVTVRVEDGEPGCELQVDTGWVVTLEPGSDGKRRRMRAFIFTPNVSRYRFVFPIERETTESAIEACEAAWEFYGGVFRVLIPDNTKAIVDKADPLEPRIVEAFLEYAQARGFHIDPARVRRPPDKGRVERSVRDVRDDCYGGERIVDIEDARRRGRTWCEREYGMRRHSTTGRMPKEHFEAVEKANLLPAPTEPYDVPIWCDPKVHRDHHVQVASALYSLPWDLKGKRVRARADSRLVRFYWRGKLVKTHPRQPPRGRSTDPNDLPDDKRAYATRDVDFLRSQAAEHGNSVGAFASRLLEGPLPWTRMRSVYAVLGLVRRFGAGRVDSACAIAIAVDMMSVRRLRRMIELAVTSEPSTAPQLKEPPKARFLRPAEQYAIPGLSPANQPKERT